MKFDLLIKNGTVVTTSDKGVFDVGISHGKVVCLGRDLPVSGRVIDASGCFVLPGGIDTHVHVEQRGNPEGSYTDTFLSATQSAACGGTTTIISHARQVKGESLAVSVADYAKRAQKSIIDYAFHMMVTDPSQQVLKSELPELIAAGHTSIKFFTASERNYLRDEQILELMTVARNEGALLLAHAENEAAINWLTERLVRSGKTEPKYNVVAKPAAAEREAVHRVATLAEIADVEIQIFHVTCEEALQEIERAQLRGQNLHGETCPQYLTLTRDCLEGTLEESVKFIFGPPPRDEKDQLALWSALRRGVLGVVSSDHAPFPFSGPGGKLEGLQKGSFATTPHGVPGLETRLPLLFSEGVSKHRIDLNTFVGLTSTNPAKLFDLYPRKGTIMVGSDADIAIWDPRQEVTIRNEELHHRVEYTPYEGMKISGWPIYTISRGDVVVEAGNVEDKGRGKWLSRIPKSRYAFQKDA